MTDSQQKVIELRCGCVIVRKGTRVKFDRACQDMANVKWGTMCATRAVDCVNAHIEFHATCVGWEDDGVYRG